MYMWYIYYYNLYWFCFFPTPTPIPLKWAEYILFAALLLVVCVIFGIMAQFYTYVNPAEVEAKFDEDEKKKNPEKENPYYTLDSVSQTRMWRSGGSRRWTGPRTCPDFCPQVAGHSVGWPLMGKTSELWTKPRKLFSKQPAMNLKIWKKSFFLREVLFKVCECVCTLTFKTLRASPAFNSFFTTQMKLSWTNLIFWKGDKIP